MSHRLSYGWVGFVKALEPGDPRRVGDYRLLGRLGSGGMGRVFLGQSPGGRPVAVKLIRPELAADEDFRARFAREVRAARKVGGIFTAPLVDADPQAPQPWLVTAYVPGPSLADAVDEQGPLPVSSVLLLAAGLAEGLGAVHAVGVVHRDLKPSNVLLAGDGPRIIDFGIARAMDGTPLTKTDLVVGSPGFMSPEQAEGRETGPPSDVFSLGSVLVFAATGEGPFGTGPGAALVYRVVHAQPATDELPAQIRPIVERCLAKNPQHRPTTDQILSDLGSPQLAPGWLPADINQVLVGYQAPGQAASAGQASQAVQAPTRPAGAQSGESAAAGSATVGLDLGRTPDASTPLPGQPPQRSPGPHLGWLWAAGALIVALIAVVVGITSHGSADVPPPTTSASHTVLTPRAVIEDYFAAINAHNWPRVWQLGCRKAGCPSYHAMVAGFRLTSRDVVTSLTTHGNAVSVRILAYETTGAVQTYQMDFVVRNGVITAGRQKLLGTSYPSGATASLRP